MTQGEYDTGLAVTDEIRRHLPGEVREYIKAYREYYIEKNEKNIVVPVVAKVAKPVKTVKTVK